MDILSMIVTAAISNPEFMKELFFFFLAWFLLKKGIEKNFDKIEKSILTLTETMAKLEQNHSYRLTNLETRVDEISRTKTKEY